MRISTTTIESFRLWSDPEQDWMSEESLLDTIRGKFVPTPAVLFGQAFGKVLERPWEFEITGGYQYKDQFLAYELMAPALALMDHDFGVFEAKASREYGDCTVVAMADQIVGAHLIEHKTTLSAFDFDKYAKSCQWRFMADIFQPTYVTHHVFCLSDAYGRLELRSIESFDLYPYPAMHDDCCDLVKRFAAYVESRGLGDMLRERQRVAV